MSFRSDVIDFGLQLKDQVSRDDISGGAAELAYRFFLALFPFFIFLAALGGFIASNLGVQDPTSEIMDMLGDSLPDDSASVIETQVRGVVEGRDASLLSVGILGAIWAAANGIGTLMKVLNRIYDVGESRSMPRRLAVSIGLTVTGAGLLVLAFVLLFVGQLYGPEIAEEVNLGGTAADALGYARWPVALAMILVAVAFIYWLAPNAEIPMKWITPGALFFGVAWIVASFALGLYVSNFGSYNATYGALGGVVILLLWFYVSSYLLLLGVEINDVLAQRVGRQTVQAEPQSIRPAEAPGPNEEPSPRAIGFAAVGLLWAMALMHVFRQQSRGREA